MRVPPRARQRRGLDVVFVFAVVAASCATDPMVFDSETGESGESGAAACEDADLQRDEAHCGVCDNACDEAEDCLAGTCTADFSDGLELLDPPRGWDRSFVMPEFRWTAVNGATEYAIRITTDAAGTAVVHQASVTDTSWTAPAHMGSAYWVTVTAVPDGETATRPYVVRGFEAGSEVGSPSPVCEDPGDVGTPFAYAVARAGDRLFATLNKDGGTVCVHDAESMDLLLTVPGPGPSFRAYGAAADHENDRVFASFFPIFGMCGDSLERVLVLENASTTFTMNWADGGTEAAHTLGYAEGRLFMSGLNQVSCFNENGYCLDLGEPCTNGAAAFVGLDLGPGTHAFQSETSWGAPGIMASSDFTVRPGVDGGLLFSDFDGAPMFEMPLAETARSIQRWDAEDQTFLIVGEWDDTLRIYRLANVPPTTESDVAWVNEVAVSDRFWQGDHDDAGRFWFPGQATRGLFRMDITP